MPIFHVLQSCVDKGTGDEDKDSMLSAIHSWAVTCWSIAPTSICENLVLQIDHPLSQISGSRLGPPQFSLHLTNRALLQLCHLQHKQI